MKFKDRIDVTLLAYNHSELTLKCLYRLDKYTRHRYRLIFVDNGSDWNHFETVRKTIVNMYPEKDYIIHRLSENKFYAQGTNYCIKLSMKSGYSKYIVTLSNDVFVTDRWLIKMISIMENNPLIGTLSPLTDNISRCCANADKMNSGFQLIPKGSRLSDINNLPERYFFARGNLPLFCGMIRRKVITKIGLLDERFFIMGNDDDYADRVRLAGFHTGIALNVFVNHVHGITKHEVFPQPGRSEIKKKHRDLLYQKRQYRRDTGSLA